MTLEQFFINHPKAALAFSGGVDSAYLLYAAKQYRCNIHAYFIKSPFQPEFEYEDARRLAEKLEVPFTVIPYDILQHPQVVENNLQRCYYCKQVLFSKLLEIAQQDGFSLLLDGTNASDSMDDRPGMRALQELQVRSPLRECGLTKDMIRALSKHAGLFTFDKPSYACLATRIPTGTSICQQQLTAIEQSEQKLFELGFRDFRVRIFHNTARLQFTESQIVTAVEKRHEIKQALQPYFEDILLDFKTR